MKEPEEEDHEITLDSNCAGCSLAYVCRGAADCARIIHEQNQARALHWDKDHPVFDGPLKRRRSCVGGWEATNRDHPPVGSRGKGARRLEARLQVASSGFRLATQVAAGTGRS